MTEIDRPLVMRANPSIPVLSMIRRVNEVIIGGSRKGRPAGEIEQWMTRFMTLSIIERFL